MDESFEVEYDGDEDGAYLVTKRIVPFDFAVIGLGLVRDLFGSFERAFSVSQVIVAQHANFQVEQRDFREQAAIEIETLTTGEE
jgi:hypothetical protein